MSAIDEALAGAALNDTAAPDRMRGGFAATCGRRGLARWQRGEARRGARLTSDSDPLVRKTQLSDLGSLHLYPGRLAGGSGVRQATGVGMEQVGAAVVADAGQHAAAHAAGRRGWPLR